MILLIDNYDSFVYNLARYFQQLGKQTLVVRNDMISIDEIESLTPEKIVLSPGPCTPNEAGISLDIVNMLAPTIPILGVCLGHQVIGQCYGGKITKAKQPMHGKASIIHHQGDGLFRNIPQQLTVGRYHSLIIERESLPSCLNVTAETDSGEIMAVRHNTFPLFGVQFHPESVLTQDGYQLLRNFLDIQEVIDVV